MRNTHGNVTIRIADLAVLILLKELNEAKIRTRST